MSKTKNSVCVTYIRSNEAQDVFLVRGNGYDEYQYFQRGTMSEQDVLDGIIS